MNILLILVAIVILIALAILGFWRLWFCRKPARSLPYGTDVIASPANGTVAVVRRFDSERVQVKKWNLGSIEVLASDVAPKGWFVLIVMTPLNVHYQRAPVSGTVLATKHVAGKFRNAVKEPDRLLTLENERNEILLQTKYGKVKVIQIAGMLARRISCYVGKGKAVGKGDVIGFINLGSQVALLLPDNVKLSVKPGDTVIDGETRIGTFVGTGPEKRPGQRVRSAQRVRT